MSAAAGRLDDTAKGAFSLRLLATDLGVTPMALYGHVDGVEGILNALAERWFVDVPDGGTQDTAGELEVLLLWYCDRVLRHPGLTSELVSRHGALPAPHQVWTDRIVGLVETMGLAADWSDILVDHLHGFALSQAAAGVDVEVALDQYRRQLHALFGAMLSAAARNPR